MLTRRVQYSYLFLKKNSDHGFNGTEGIAGKLVPTKIGQNGYKTVNRSIAGMRRSVGIPPASLEF